MCPPATAFLVDLRLVLGLQLEPVDSGHGARSEARGDPATWRRLLNKFDLPHPDEMAGRSERRDLESSSNNQVESAPLLVVALYASNARVNLQPSLHPHTRACF